MTLYAPTDVQSIIIPEGCGQSHGIDAGAQLIIECGPCERAMGAHQHLGWAASPDKVAPTCDERAQAERDEDAAKKAGIARLNLYANTGGADGSSTAALAALVEQNSQLMAKVMELTAALGAPVISLPPANPLPASPLPKVEDPTAEARTYDHPVTWNLPETPAAPAVDVVDAPPAKRGPGRPRRSPEAV